MALVAAASCNQVAGIRDGLPGDEMCIMGAEGTPLPEQTAGDCAQLVCDGAGSAKQVPSPADVPDDRNICTTDGCFGMTPVHTLTDFASCYTGPEETEGVGVCQVGRQRCDELGSPVGGCDGEVTPQPEVCDSSGDDEDCDGEANEEGDDCACGDGWVSAGEGEECDDGGTIDGDGCAASCVTERVVKIESGHSHTCAVLNTGRIKCWGLNGNGQLGLGDRTSRGRSPGQMGAALPVADLGAGANVASLAMGGLHTCARMTSGAVKCWGRLFVGSSPVHQDNVGEYAHEMGDRLPFVGLDGPATELAAGAEHTCALVSGDVMLCWGDNGSGQLGLGDREHRRYGDGSSVSLGDGMVASSLALGESHTCARLSDRSVKCWGANDAGQLGLGDTNPRGDDLNEMGASLPVVDLGGEPVLGISAGLRHTCALLIGGRVKCWGRNNYGQLGIGDTSSRGSDMRHMGDNLGEVDVGAAATALAAGGDHTCALLDSGRVKCWGFNDSGQLGLGDKEHRGDAPDEMGGALPPVDLGEGATVEAITAGAKHTCALLTDGRIKCWGLNDSGELGLGDTANRGDGPDEMGDALPAVELFKSP
ncbi:hypothetical protein WMF30_33780 [Sorangium sp. So ce134]